MSKGDELKFERRAAAKAGTELGIPTDEMRRRNCVPEMPWTTPNGCVYDSGDYPAMLELAKEMIRWDDWSSWRLLILNQGARRLAMMRPADTEMMLDRPG